MEDYDKEEEESILENTRKSRFNRLIECDGDTAPPFYQSSTEINKNSALLYMTMDLAIFFSLWCWTHEIFYRVVGWGVNKKSSIGI